MVVHGPKYFLDVGYHPYLGKCIQLGFLDRAMSVCENQNHWFSQHYKKAQIGNLAQRRVTD